MILSLDYRSSHVHSRSVGASGSSSGGGGGSSRRSEEKEGLSREPSQKGSSSASQPHAPPSQHLGLCHIHLREQQQLRELQQQAEEQLDINENLVSHSRSRTKSDPTLKSAESIIACPESHTEREEVGDGGGSGFRGRAKTLERPNRSGRFFCDSCKARLKAEGLMVDDGRGGGSSGKQQCSSACASRDAGAVDLMALPLPGSDDDEEIDEEGAGKLQPPPPAIAAPPPGFRDNSSDEDDPNKYRKAAAKVEGAAKATAATATRTTAASTVVAEASAAAAATATVATATMAETQEDVPVTLIDNVATRTVRDHAQELDDALVSTLQALEALAASEDYPHHHQQTPQTAGGLTASQNHILLYL